MVSLPPVCYFGLHLTEKSEAGETALWAPKHPASTSKMAPSDWMLYLSIKRSSSSAGGLLACWAGPGGHSAVSNVLQIVFTQTQRSTLSVLFHHSSRTLRMSPMTVADVLLWPQCSSFKKKKGGGEGVVWHVFSRHTTGIYHSGAVKVQVLETYILFFANIAAFWIVWE